MQVILVIIAIGGAASYLAWQLYVRFFRKEKKCESCAFNQQIK